MNYWCINLYLKCFRQSWKRHCSLSFLILYQTSVVLSVCGCWLLQNLEKRKKSIKLNILQIEVFFLPNISPLPLIKAHQICPLPEYTPGRIIGTLRYYNVSFHVILSSIKGQDDYEEVWVDQKLTIKKFSVTSL